MNDDEIEKIEQEAPQISVLETGAHVIRSEAERLPETPGVYRMIAANGDVLYVGKAKALKKRVLSYTLVAKLLPRLQRMVAQTVRMEFVHTRTEVEALLLESNLIKKLKPRYNILLRDDKSFPYIMITGDHDFPQVVKHRGVKKRKGQYFGPFASAGKVNEVLYVLQRAFMLRNCSDSVFAHRTRPCLQYHIKRCTAPCVKMVDQARYAEQVRQAEKFLTGKSQTLQAELSSKMMAASAEMKFEEAAFIRDRLRAMSSVQTHQDIHIDGVGDADVFVLEEALGQICIQVYFFRAGGNYGGRAYFPRHAKEDEKSAVLASFLAQFYENKPVPREIILSHEPQERELLAEALSARAGNRVEIVIPQRGEKMKVIAFASHNARLALERARIDQAREEQLLEALAGLLDLEEAPTRIEVYDNSHISGTNMVGAMIVAGPEGFLKNAYRKFNIKKATAGDDYGMMREVMERRFGRALREDAQDVSETWPDLVLIDGGQGQWSACRAILEELGIAERVHLVSIAKGEDRNAGRETFFMEGKPAFQLPMNDPALHYLQRLRDEAHRFAISAHRSRRQSQIRDNPLDEISGIGAARKKALLLYFGSAKDVADAGIEDLQKVEGISRALAEKIYNHFH